MEDIKGPTPSNRKPKFTKTNCHLTQLKFQRLQAAGVKEWISNRTQVSSQSSLSL